MILLVFVGTFLASALANKCPDPTSIQPCTCNDEGISCFAYNNDIDLQEIFEAVAYKNEDNPGWNTFELTSNSITELPADVFQGARFRTIKLNFNPKLACIHPRAFAGMESYTWNFLATNTDLSKLDENDKPECQLFTALSSLSALKVLNITASGITKVPDKAFHYRQDSLTMINLSGGQGGSIKSIGKSAFSPLKNIQHIDLSYHRITSIDTFAFSMTEPSDGVLTINLEHNTGLSGDSFTASTFEVRDRKTTLRLGANPGLKFLKEETFLNFLANKANPNTIDLTGSYLDYYYENEWLFEYRVELNLASKIRNAMTVDGQQLWLSGKSKFTVTPTAATPTPNPSPTEVKGSTTNKVQSTPSMPPISETTTTKSISTTSEPTKTTSSVTSTQKASKSTVK